MRHTFEKLSTRVTILLQTSSQLEFYTQSYGPPKSQKSQLWEFRNSQLWEFRNSHLGSETKWHLGAGPMVRHKVYCKGEVVASPKFGSWWILWVRVSPWLVHAPKCYNYALTNLLFDLCRSMWVSEVLVNLPSPIPELQHAPLPLKCCELRSTPQLLLLPLSHLDSQLNPSKNLGVCHLESPTHMPLSMNFSFFTM